MYVVNGVLKWTDRVFTALGILAALGTLYLWYEAIRWWGEAGAMASALTWTVVTIVLFGTSMLLEYLRTRGE
jgi:hypothetical protein